MVLVFRLIQSSSKTLVNLEGEKSATALFEGVACTTVTVHLQLVLKLTYEELC